MHEVSTVELLWILCLGNFLCFSFLFNFADEEVVCECAFFLVQGVIKASEQDFQNI